MRRLLPIGALAAALVACHDLNVSLASVTVYPILDSLFVGDGGAARTVVYLNDRGDTAAPAGVHWVSTNPTVASVDYTTGAITALAPGYTVITAQVGNAVGGALLVVSKPLDLRVLLDTIYLMQGDTFTVPVQLKRKGGGTLPPVWFQTQPTAVYAIDSATGRITAMAPGGPIKFVAHADTIVDSGTVEVVSLSDTVGGKGYFTIFGTIIRRLSAATRAVNYLRHGDTLTFRLRTALLSGGATFEAVVLTSRQPVLGPGTFLLDSITPLQAFGQAYGYDPLCRPLQNWGLWSTRVVVPNVAALSRLGGVVTITQDVPVANGRAISGRYDFQAQRTDEYTDPLGTLPIRGTFVAPVVTDSGPCIS